MNNLFRDVSNKVDRVFKSMIFAAAAGAAAIASLFFFSLAAFLLFQVWYGTFWASVIMGAIYALIALAALITVLVLGRRKSSKPTAQAPPPKPLWQDPLVVSSALQLVKSMRPRTLLTLAAVGAFVAGLVLTGPKNNKPTDKT